ncbi:integrase catalytic domain-containing protein [Nephila pilipes]|uniref:Integrase catalytic domain-containing protein n=1 Tax=Nephila pilipes TaxID=299642 RepID=A0A8X6P6L8_NEPPI|nr:integrase catalytic domain-containing protein [Nephila pilipes]
MDADKIKNKRKALKCGATKFVNSLDTTLVNESNVHTLEILYHQLIEKIDSLKVSDNELLSVIDAKDIEKEVEQSEAYMENLITYKCKITQKIASLTSPVVPPTFVNPTNVPISTIDTFSRRCRSESHFRFALTESNYDAALELLRTRFGQKNLLINAHLGSLLSITPIKNTSDTNSLRKLYDRAETEIRNLESLGINSESYGNLLTPILLKVLPSDLTLEFCRKNKSDNWDLKALLEFLGEEIQSCERAQSFHSSVKEKHIPNSSNQECSSFAFGSRSYNRSAYGKQRGNNSSAAELLVNHSSANNKCIFCGENLHDSSSCDSFEENIQFRDGRYVVKLPWKDNLKESLDNNYEIAHERFSKLCDKFKNDQSLYTEYKNVIDSYVEQNIVERVPNSNVVGGAELYLPHRTVIRHDRVSSKLRIVFDASSHKRGKFSLNDSLHIGPNPDLFELLLSFRKHPIAFTVDIKQAFLNVELDDSDKNVTKFFWTDNPESFSESLEVLRFNRVLFGINSSPFLLTATIKYHLKKYSSLFPQTHELLNKFVYVDDVLGGQSTVASAYTTSLECVQIFSEANMPLHKWATNSAELRELELKDSELWWHGPPWLKQTEQFWPKIEKQNVSSLNLELKSKFRDISQNEVILENREKLLNIDKFSSYLKLLRVTAFVFRYIYNTRNTLKKRGAVDTEELKESEEYWIKEIQKETYGFEIIDLEKTQKVSDCSKIRSLVPYLDDRQILRIKGRLDESELSLDEKQPILLPQNSKFTELLILREHTKNFHSGVTTTLKIQFKTSESNNSTTSKR